MTRILIALLYLLLASATAGSETTTSTSPAYVPTDAERARWTMGDMTSWKIVFEAYKTDYNAYPTIQTTADALKFFEPVYIRKLPVNDAWGQPYRIVSDGKTFRVVSAGADGVFQESSWSTPGKNTSFNDDAVLSNEGRGLTRSWEYK